MEGVCITRGGRSEAEGHCYRLVALDEFLTQVDHVDLGDFVHLAVKRHLDAVDGEGL